MPEECLRGGLVGACLVGGICSSLTRAAEEQEKPHGAASSAKPQHGRVTGILIAKDDKSITVKAEGAQESTRYLLPAPGGSKTDVRAAMKRIFVPNLVAMEWERQDEPVVTAIAPIMPKQRSGVVTGTIVAQASGKRRLHQRQAGRPRFHRALLASLRGQFAPEPGRLRQTGDRGHRQAESGGPRQGRLVLRRAQARRAGEGDRAGDKRQAERKRSRMTLSPPVIPFPFPVKELLRGEQACNGHAW